MLKPPFLFFYGLLLLHAADGIPSRRVDISDNCASVIEKKSVTAKKLQASISALSASHLDELYLYESLDTILTLLSTNPTERKFLQEYCDGHGGAAGSNWVPVEAGNEACFVFTETFRALKKEHVMDAEGMEALAKLPTGSQKIYQMNTKTEKAKSCFDKVKVKSIKLPTFSNDVIDKALKRKSRSVETEVFGDLYQAVNPLPVMLVVKRPAGSTSDWKTNRNLSVNMVFASLNDAEFPIHSAPVVALLTQHALDELVGSHSIGLEEMLRNFCYQAVVINDAVNDSVTAAVIKVAAETGISKLHQGHPHAGFEEFPPDLTKFIQQRSEINPEKHCPLVLGSQVLIIGHPITGLVGPHVIKPMDALKLVSIAPPAEVAAPSGVEVANQLEEAIRGIFKAHNNIQTVYVQMAPSWFIRSKPHKVVMDNPSKTTLPVHYLKRGETPKETGQKVLYITNSKKKWDAAHDKMTAYYDVSMHDTPGRTIKEFLVANPNIDKEPNHDAYRAKAEESIVAIWAEHPIKGAEAGGAAATTIAEALLDGGIESWTMLDAAGLPKRAPAALHISDALKRQGILATPAGQKVAFSRKILYFHPTTEKPPPYFYRAAVRETTATAPKEKAAAIKPKKQKLKQA